MCQNGLPNGCARKSKKRSFFSLVPLWVSLGSFSWLLASLGIILAPFWMPWASFWHPWGPPKWCPGSAKFNENESSNQPGWIHFSWVMKSLGIILAPLTPAINVICWCPGIAYSLAKHRLLLGMGSFLLTLDAIRSYCCRVDNFSSVQWVPDLRTSFH